MTTATIQNHGLHSEIAQDIILRWFRVLHSEHKNAERAQLKRCTTIEEAFWHREYYELLRTLEESNVRVRTSTKRTDSEHALATIVLLASHIKEHDSHNTIGKQFASAVNGQRGLSDLRFRRLLSTQDVSTLFPHLRRAINLKGGMINVAGLIRLVARWRPDSQFPNPSHNPRIQLAEEFYTSK